MLSGEKKNREVLAMTGKGKGIIESYMSRAESRIVGWTDYDLTEAVALIIAELNRREGKTWSHGS